jgi:hypothetical protein
VNPTFSGKRIGGQAGGIASGFALGGSSFSELQMKAEIANAVCNPKGSLKKKKRAFSF